MKKIFLNIIFLTMLISACTKQYPLDLGKNYKLDYDGNSYFYLLDSNNMIIINSHIMKFDFDSTFIIVSQRPWNIISGYDTMTIAKYDKAFENSTFKQYWIINKREPSIYSYDSINKMAKYSNVYGPYNWDEYLQKRKKIGVPKELKLNEK